jgi:hypothetical protein
MQAGRLLANLIVAGGGILLRAAAQAYRQAIVSEPADSFFSGHTVSGVFSVTCLYCLSLCMQSHEPALMLLADAQRSGVTAESVKAATKARQMSLEEAEKILGISRNTSYDEVLKVRLPPICHNRPTGLDHK